MRREQGCQTTPQGHSQIHIPILIGWELRLVMFMRTVLHHPELNNTYAEEICALLRKSGQNGLLE